MTLRSVTWVAASAFAAVALFTGCASNAHIEKDASADFSKYRSYAWLDQPAAKETKKSRKNDLTETSIRNAVNKQLSKNGWKEVRSNPDVMVSYDLLVERNQKQQQDPVYSDAFVRRYYNRYTGRVNTIYYPSQFMGYDSYSTTVKEGTVTITMIDNRTDKTVFQGWATNELVTSNISGREIDQSVKSIFKKFDAGK